jgi:hypothetical protein
MSTSNCFLCLSEFDGTTLKNMNIKLAEHMRDLHLFPTTSKSDGVVFYIEEIERCIDILDDCESMDEYIEKAKVFDSYETRKERILEKMRREKLELELRDGTYRTRVLGGKAELLQRLMIRLAEAMSVWNGVTEDNMQIG